MRKITQQAAAAFETGRQFKSGNTSVSVDDRGVILSLHGNAIACKDPDGTLRVRSAGWETSTTKERLNGISGVSVWQSKGLWYLNGTYWENSSNWTKVA
jgi:hypothetical protein